MHRTNRSHIGWIVWALALQLIPVSRLFGDVIYLSNGNILLVDKAWEEGDEVKYKTSRGIQSLPKSSVQSIKQEKPVPAPSSKKWNSAAGSGIPSGAGASVSIPPASPSSDGKTTSKEALDRLRANLRTNPSDKMAERELVLALNSAASLQAAQGDFPSAQHSLEEALNYEKNDPTLLANLGIVFFRLGNYAKAEDTLSACIQVDRTNQWAYMLLGEACYRQEKIAQAISKWSEGLRLGPNETISERLETARRESSVHNELRELKSSHFILRYDRKGTSLPLGDQILSTLEELYRRLANQLTSHTPETVAVILYPDQEYFDITRAPGWTGGLYDGKIRIPIKGLYTVTSDLKAALSHELTHCFMIALPGRGTPTWFLEGVAQMQEARSTAGDRKWLVQMQHSKQLIPLKDLRGSYMNLPAGKVDLAYTESLSAVEYLSAKFGRSAIRNLLDLLAQNYSFENAFNSALQQNVSEFETAWQDNLAQ